VQYSRRKLLTSLPVWAFAPEVFADLLLITPSQTAGPFYPDELPLDKDNDLIVVNNSITVAVGQILHLSGQVFDVRGNTIKDALIEIWQTDAKGRYIHSQDFRENENDKNFQGYGLFQTASNGAYRFRTIRPVAYGSGFGRRTPHIHVAIRSKEHRPLVTQVYFADEDNSSDGLWSRLPELQRKNLTVLPKKITDSQLNEQAATFNIVLA